MIQGSEEWRAARCGLATASRFKDVLAKIKTGEAATRRNYRVQLVAERMTGKPMESFTNADMRWGTEQEPFARMQYESLSGSVVAEVGFVRHPEIVDCGASPDGLLGDDGMTEYKCPQTATHIDTLLCGMPKEHMPQVQGLLWVTGRAWCDFVSYDPRLPEHLSLYVQRVFRDEQYIAELAAEVTTFLNEVSELIDQLERKAASWHSNKENSPAHFSATSVAKRTPTQTRPAPP